MSETPITDEELVQIQLIGPWEPTDLVPRLIAALKSERAALKSERAEVERLKKIINEYRSRDDYRAEMRA